MNEYISEIGKIIGTNIVEKRVAVSRVDPDMDFPQKREAERILIRDLSGRGVDQSSYAIHHEPYSINGKNFMMTFGVAI